MWYNKTAAESAAMETGRQLSESVGYGPLPYCLCSYVGNGWMEQAKEKDGLLDCRDATRGRLETWEVKFTVVGRVACTTTSSQGCESGGRVRVWVPKAPILTVLK